MRVRKKDFRAWDIGERWDAIVSERLIDHRALIINDHALKQRDPNSLRDCTLHLSTGLHRIDDRTRIVSVNALKDTNFARNSMDRDTKAMHQERRSSWRVVRFTRNMKFVPKWRPGGNFF